MLVLVYPMFSRTAINADSCYNVIRTLVTEALRQRDDVHFDILWPSNGKDWSYFKDGFFDLRRVRRLPLRFHPAKMKQVVSFAPFEIGDYLDYKVPYDVIWNHVPEVGDLLKNNVASYNPSGKSAVVNTHLYVVHDSLPYPVEHDQLHVMLRQLVGSVGVDAHVVDSTYCGEMLFDNARKYLSDPLIARLEGNVREIPLGVLDNVEFAPYAAIRKADTFTFAYNHRLQNYKKYKDTFDAFAFLHDVRGLKFRVIVFGMPSDENNMSYVSKFPWCDVFISTTRDQYLAKLATCHANVTNSVHETFCIAAVESMALGQVVIAPNGVTFPEITDGTDTLFAKEHEQHDLMTRVIEDTAWREATATTQNKHVWAAYNVERFARAYLDLFDEVADNWDVSAAIKHPEEMRALIESKSEWVFEDLRKIVYQMRVDGKNIASAQSFPANRLKRLVNNWGYKDERAPRTGDLLMARR